MPGNVNVIVKQSVGHFSFNYWRGFMYDDDKVRHFTSSEVFNFCSPGTFHLFIFIFIFIFKRENIASAKHIQYYAPLQNAIFLVLLCARGLAALWIQPLCMPDQSCAMQSSIFQFQIAYCLSLPSALIKTNHEH